LFRGALTEELPGICRQQFTLLRAHFYEVAPGDGRELKIIPIEGMRPPFPHGAAKACELRRRETDKAYKGEPAAGAGIVIVAELTVFEKIIAVENTLQVTGRHSQQDCVPGCI